MSFPLRGDLLRTPTKFSTDYFAAVVDTNRAAVLLKSRADATKQWIQPYDLPGGGVWDVIRFGPETILPERMKHWLGVTPQRIGPQIGQLIPGEFGPEGGATIDFAQVHLIDREHLIGEPVADGNVTAKWGYFDLETIKEIPLLGPDDKPGRMAEMVFAALSVAQSPIYNGQIEHAPAGVLDGIVRVDGRIGQSLGGEYYVEYFRVGFVRIWKRIVPLVSRGSVVGYK